MEQGLARGGRIVRAIGLSDTEHSKFRLRAFPVGFVSQGREQVRRACDRCRFDIREKVRA